MIMNILLKAKSKKYNQCLIMFLMLFFPLFVSSQNVKEVEERLLKQAEDNIEKYRKGNAEIQFQDTQGAAIKNAKVEIIQQGHDFLFGCIIFDLIRNENAYREDLFKQQFKRIFNLAIFPFYWPGYERIQGAPVWESMLPTIEWCKLNGITTKGHPLVWACRSGTPPWLRKYTIDETEELLKSRVMNIVSGFDDKIELWDVVNEPVNVKTWRNKIENMDDPNDWGVEDPINEVADYVENALKWAHQANPTATLMINEYRTIADLKVRERYYELLKELKNRKAPLTKIGIQENEQRRKWFNRKNFGKHLICMPVWVSQCISLNCIRNHLALRLPEDGGLVNGLLKRKRSLRNSSSNYVSGIHRWLLLTGGDSLTAISGFPVEG